MSVYTGVGAGSAVEKDMRRTRTIPAFLRARVSNTLEKTAALIFLHTILLQYTHNFTTVYTLFYYSIHTVLLQYTHYFTTIYE
jgi:hypothetical protein